MLLKATNWVSLHFFRCSRNVMISYFLAFCFVLSISAKSIQLLFHSFNLFSLPWESDYHFCNLSQLHLDSMIPCSTSVNSFTRKEHPPLLPFLLHFLLWCTHHATTTITTSTIAPPADAPMIIHSSLSSLSPEMLSINNCCSSFRFKRLVFVLATHWQKYTVIKDVKQLCFKCTGQKEVRL